MRAPATLHYPALACAVVPVLLVAVSCGDDGGEPVATATTLASPTPAGRTPTVGADQWRPPLDLAAVPLSESDALWRDIWTNAVLVDPVLRPTYLPPSLTWFRGPFPEEWPGGASFTVLYSDSEGQTWLMLEAGRPGREKARHPGSHEERILLRDALATYLLWDPAAPTGDAWLCWDEPGSWGKPGRVISSPQDRVGYCILSRGLPKEELIRVTAALRPVASLMPVPTRVPSVPVSEADALWEWIAAKSPECEPMLRPTYLPSNLTRVTLDLAEERLGCVLFNVTYTDSAGEARLSIGGGPWFNAPPLPEPDTVYEDVELRGITGGYTLRHAAEPSGLAWLTWHEPGRWGKLGSDWHRDYVEYLMSSEGFSKEELLKVANALEPIER